MTNNNTSLNQLKAFLNQLFQFDSQDLDFGVYKILYYKKKEIANFINQLLVDKVREQLQTLSDDDAKQIKQQLAELEKEDIIKGWLEAEVEEKKTLEKFGKDKINQYKELKAKATEASVSAETENQIYNHLTLFFSRYYDKGDFISKRRFGKNEKYMVPYNGEETYFHWANHDQYYIKSSETFNHYAFKVQTADGNLVVNFKLHDAQMEQGNVKAEETNFFLLADKAPEIKERDDTELNFVLANKQPDIDKKEITIYFEYRPLADKEKTKVRGNNKQDTLDEIAFEFLKKEFSNNTIFANLWKEQEGKPLLLKKLQHYTRKNKHDFFIHKNLKGFLERELDYFIKSELVNVDDMYVTDTDAHFGRLKHNLKTIKVFKSIADTIIDFVSQIEDFQKKLWEKKKFVMSTEWVITIDKLVDYIGEKTAQPIIEEVIKNEKQVAEWIELYDEKNVPTELLIDSLKADLHTWRRFPIDTINFSISFKYKLLNELSNQIDIEDLINGIVLHSDNYAGVRVLSDKYNEKIQSIYIDPPYNTDASQIIYKNGYRTSSWASLINDRVMISKPLLQENGILCATIDDFQRQELQHVMKSNFSNEGVLGTICIRINPSGRITTKGLAQAHEYAIFMGNPEKSLIGKLPRTEIQQARFDKKDSKGIYEQRNFRREGSSSDRAARPKLYYPFYVKGKNIRIPEFEWQEESRSYKILEEPLKSEVIVYPIDDNGTQRVWRWGHDTVNAKLTEIYPKKNTKGDIQIYYKYRPNKEGVLASTIWVDKKYSATEYGTAVLKNLFGNRNRFDYPKSIFAVEDCIRISSNTDSGWILDYFAGSGTTFHATQILNRDGGSRKCILIEQGPYLETVIVPRIKKIAYTYNWKKGEPSDNSMNGLGVFFKYQRLEQYEEALENIALNASEETLQKAVKFEQYIPKYFLEFEAKNSQTMVNTSAMKDPWDYKLKMWDGFTYDTEQTVDLVETFNYLIGLHMQKCFTKEINDNKYQFIIGNNNTNKKIAVVWRNVRGWALDDYKADSEVLKKELKNFSYDLLYINDQAHIEGYQPIEEVFKNKMLS